MLRLFQESIENIVKNVKNKLNDDQMKSCLVTTNKPTKDTVETLVVKDYIDFQLQFDQVLLGVGDYFELFKNNTNKLEDIWLQLLDYLKLKNHLENQVFKRIHYSTYVRNVIE